MYRGYHDILLFMPRQRQRDRERAVKIVHRLSTKFLLGDISASHVVGDKQTEESGVTQLTGGEEASASDVNHQDH